MERIYDELIKEEYWQKAYDKLIVKKGIPNELKETLYCMLLEKGYTDIVNQLLDGSYKWSVPEKLLLAKSGTTKKRVVYMYSMLDRFILGALYRALSEVFKDRVADNCFSYKKGVNTCHAVKYIEKTKSTESMYGVKLDISAYFNSVSREHLNNCLTELFGVDTGIRKTMDNLFNNDTITYRGNLCEEYKALIPGCALGSFFANYCLKDIDKYFWEKNIIYARYSDDIVLFADTREELDNHLVFIKSKLKEYNLSINEKKYVYFEPSESIDFLGLKLDSDGIDISDHAKNKVKKTIKRWVKAGRKEIELKDKDFDKVARNLVKRLNWKFYKSYVEDHTKFGWGYYAFRYITKTDSLTEIDFYLRDRLRYMKTGKNNKANIKALDDTDFRELGVLSLYDMYDLFHTDFDYYCEVAYLI